MGYSELFFYSSAERRCPSAILRGTYMQERFLIPYGRHFKEAEGLPLKAETFW